MLRPSVIPPGWATPRSVLTITHQSTSNPGNLGHLLRQQGFTLDLCCPALGQPLPQHLQSYAAVVILGGPMSANDDDTQPFIRAELDWLPLVLESGKPFLGICLGAQLLARVLGAKVAPHPQGQVEVGYCPLEPLAHGPLLGLDRVFHWHNEGFDLPWGARLLARNDTFPHQAFSYGQRAYGLQFHPEITLAMVQFWNQQAADMVQRPGAQPHPQQIQEYHQVQSQVKQWLEGFLDSWLCSPLGDYGSRWDAAH
ncbi:glutamine amidotransferase-related protein [Prochlorothrix hollandica]|uniref:Glutamine amidotransferase n=1 Tax=Prochlorothrix hollandica PCC 9006 = CALU 1027 TaxID=317619 RepID=A0A0M2PXS7_PROHO|nr:hypothetical protein [Prochlorothrix hollandica]KKJ00975.1 glutamine amidotransferase [Prochlorothrix hollandica PCC 9006 = CALU 1027]